MLTTFAAQAHKELDAQTNSVSNWLLSGKAADYAEYRFMVGQLKGLESAKRTVDELLHAANNSEA